MKTLILITLIVSSLPSFAACPIYSAEDVSPKLERVLNKYHFELTNNKNAAYSLKQEQVEIVTPIIRLAYGETKLLRKREGFSTIFNIHKNSKFFHQSYGDAYNIFADEFYVPTTKLKNRSIRKALRNLKQNLPACEE